MGSTLGKRVTRRRDFARATALLLLLLLCGGIAPSILACGSRTGLYVDEQATNDGGVVDTGIGVDAPFDVVPTSGRLELIPHRALVELPWRSSPGTQAWRALLHREDGSTSDVTSTTTFTVDGPPLGSFSGALFTSIDPERFATMYPEEHSTRVLASLGPLKAHGCIMLVAVNPGEALFVLPFAEAPQPARRVLALSTASAPKRGPIRIDPDPGTGYVHPSPFVVSLRAMSEGSAELGCPPIAVKDRDGDGVAELFLDVVPGTMVCVEITVPSNTLVAETPAVQEFWYTFTLRGTDTIFSPTVGSGGAVFVVPALCP